MKQLLKLAVLALLVLSVAGAATAGVRYATKRWVKKYVAKQQQQQPLRVFRVVHEEALDGAIHAYDYASCPAGTTVVGGGLIANNVANDSMTLSDSGPSLNRWRVAYRYNGVGDPGQAYTYALCLEGASVVEVTDP